MPAPSNIVLSSSSLCYEMPNGTVVADITVEGILTCTNYTLTLLSDYGGTYTIVNNQLILADNQLLLPNILTPVTIQAVDDLGNSLTQSFNISILDCSGYAPILYRIVPTASKVGTAPAAYITGKYLTLGGPPVLTINGQTTLLISYTDTRLDFAMPNLPMGTYTANVTNGNNLTGSLPFFRYTSDVGPDQNLGNLKCTSKPSMSLVFDSDGAGGKYGATMYVTPPNANMQYLQVYLKYNYQFDWRVGGDVTLSNAKLLTGDLVYLAGQQVPSEDGVYIVQSGPWTFYTAVTPNIFIDLGARSYDIIDGNLSRDIITDMGVNFGVPGVYTITYYSMNSMGVLSFVQRHVNVLSQVTVDIGGIDGNPIPTNKVVIGSISPGDGYWITDYQVHPVFDQELVNQLLLTNSFYAPRCAADLIGTTGDISNLTIQDLGIYIRKDGLTIFIADESMTGFKLIDGAAGSMMKDSVILSQLQDVLSSTPRVAAQVTAGETINALQVVYIGVDGFVHVADNNNPLCINTTFGIAMNTANATQPIMVCSAGSVNGFSGLVTTQNYWLGSAGSLVTTAPTSGISQLLGIAISTTEFMLLPQIPIIV